MLDFCVGFNGYNSDILSRMFFGLLRRHCDLSDVQVHIVDNGIPPGVEIEGHPPSTVCHKIMEGWTPVRGRYFTDSMLPQWRMIHWIIDNCGTSEWCVLCDFDMILRRDVLTLMRESMLLDVGIIGSHGTNHNQLTPLFAISREAWKHRRVTFEAGPGRDGKQVDLGILLAKDLDAQGHRWIKFAPDMEDYFHHMGGGGGYHTKEELEAMRFRVGDICQELGL